MFDKYEFIDSIIVQLDKAFDARGSERAVILIDLIQRMKALKDGLAEDEKNTAGKIENLKKQHKAQMQDLTGGEAIGGQEFHIGVDGTVNEVK